ncbi:MAG: hypothetical protein ACOVKR_06390 [Limnohabitans sp.]
MTSTESFEPASSVYDSCDPKFLRELREASGMDVFVLARTACLSVAQVRQLESDAGGNLFYSLTIKRQAYKRLLMILGAEPPTVEVPEAFRHAHQVAQAHLNTLDQIVAMSHLPSMQRSTGDALRERFDKLMAHKHVIGSVLLLLLAALVFIKFGERQSPEPAMASSASSTAIAAPEPKATPAPEALVAAPAASVALPAPTSTVASASLPAVAAVSMGSPAKPAACAFTEDELPSLTPFTANKEGRYVYLVSNSDAVVCVVDGTKQATSLALKAGEGRSIYGASPWQLSGASLAKVQIYFQGGRVSLPDAAATRVKLIEVPVTR